MGIKECCEYHVLSISMADELAVSHLSASQHGVGSLSRITEGRTGQLTLSSNMEMAMPLAAPDPARPMK